MSYLAPKLNKRIQIQTPVQTANADGTLGLTYTTIKTIWAGVEIYKGSFIDAVRGVNADDMDSHIITVRASALTSVGAGTSSAFNFSLDSIEDINQVKTNYFLFLQKGSDKKGRRFRISGIRLDEKNTEYVILKVKELSEEGTGWPSSTEL